MKRILYDSGLPFNKQLAINYNDLNDRVKNKKASLILIDGGVGEGKTTLLIHTIDYFNKINGLPPYDLSEGSQLAMGGADFLKKLEICFEKGLPIIAYDEAGDFNRRGSLTQFNATLNRTFETFRAFKIVVVIALPNFSVLDQQLFDNQIPRLLLHLRNRTENYGYFTAYSLYAMLQMKSIMKKLVVKPYGYKITEPNFDGCFLDLEENRSKELDKISIKSKIDILRKSEAKIEGLLNYPEIANKLLKSVRWVKIKVRELKLKPVRTINRAKYFNQEQFAQICDFVDENKT